MKKSQKVLKAIISVLVSMAIFVNLTLSLGITVNAKEINASTEKQTTNDEKEISKVTSPDVENIKETNGEKYVNNSILIFFKDDVQEEEVNDVIQSVNGSVIGQVSVLNEYQVKVKESTLDELNDMTANIMDQYSEYVDYACVDSISESASIEPNDPWGEDNEWDSENVSGNNWGMEAVQAQQAWQYNNIFDESVDKVNVGVVDGGFDTSGEDFPQDYEKYNDSDVTLPFDHGTFVTSIIAAKANNNKGVTGLVWNPGKVYLASAAADKYGSLTLSGLVKGLTDVIDNGANVINCSFGGGSQNDSRVSAILMARMLKKGHDFVIVQASGNSSRDADYSYWFAGIGDTELEIASKLYGVNEEDIKDRIIIVGAAELQEDGTYMQAEYSNGGTKVDICAPGSSIYSQGAQNNYYSGDGTSYAAPHMAGIVELAWRANPNLTGAEVKDIVCDYNNTIYDVKDNPNSYYTTGDYRMANAKLSVESALKTRDDLVTIYYNSKSDINVSYKLDSESWANAKTIKMNDNEDNNGYSKSITIPIGDAKYILAKFGTSSNWDDNKGSFYKLTPGAYTIENGTINKTSDKFAALKIVDFVTDEGKTTTVGDHVKLSTKVANESSNVQYAYSAIDEDGNEKIIRNYSTDSNATWFIYTEGKYTLVAKAKDDRGYVATKKINFTVGSKAKVTKYSIDPVKVGEVGKKINMNVNIIGGKGSVKCMFLAQGGDYPYGQKDKYFTMQGNTFGTWTPDMKGTYRIYCDTEDESGVHNREYLFTYTVTEEGSNPIVFTTLNTSKSSNIEVGEDILINFNFYGGFESDVNFAYTKITATNEDGTVEEVASGFYYRRTLNSIKWAPTKSGKWTININIGNTTDEYKASKEMTINVNEYKKDTQSENTTTIYYKGYSNPYIHYGINNKWTDVPGVKMEATNELSGYTHKYTIDLGDSDRVLVCFNDGNGNWDSRNGQNYTFNAGVYTYSNGSYEKIADNSSDFAVAYFKANYDSPRTAGTNITLRAETVKAEGDVEYTFAATNEDGEKTSIASGSSNKVTWTPSEGGNYVLSVVAKDSKGHTDKKTMNYKINDVVKITKFTIDKSELVVGQPVKLYAEAEGGTGEYRYEFYTRNLSGTSTGGIYSSEAGNEITWTPTYPGTIRLGVGVYDDCGYRAEYDVVVTIEDFEKDPLAIYYISSPDKNIVKNKECNINVVMYYSGVGEVNYKAYAIYEDGTKETITTGSNSNVLKWTPSKSGKCMVCVNAEDSIGQKAYSQTNFNVVDKVENYVTIYYNGWENTNIHYKIGDGSWTSVPGVPMIKTDELEGYTHKITIPLGEATKLTCCFNDGNGNWDNNNRSDYTLEPGEYLIDNGEVSPVTLPDSLIINHAWLSKGTIKLGESIDITTKVFAQQGECKYTIVAINQDTGKFEEIAKEDKSSVSSWKPSEKGTWYVYLLVEDEAYCNDGGIMKLVVE